MDNDAVKQWTTYEQWNQWQRDGYTMLPYLLRIPFTGTIATWEEMWREASEQAFVLESGKDGRYCFIGTKPESFIAGKVGGEPDATADPLQEVKQWMQPYRAPKAEGAPKFTGGCVGFWGYDVVRSLERIPSLAADELPVPDYLFMRFTRIWCVDLVEREVWVCVQQHVGGQDSELEAARPLHERFEEARQAAQAMAAQWQRWMEAAERNPAVLQRKAALERFKLTDQLQVDIDALQGLKRSFSREQFQEAVRRIQAYISAGDVFQVNLSVRQSRPTQAVPEDVYEWLRLFNPSPYMGLIRFGRQVLVSASPELLVRLENGKLSTRPIAGTRPRGPDPDEDARMEAELRGSEKENAEHIMLVDLLRNDIGRVSAYGSVKVDELMVVERYSHVMHLVSEITGELAAKRDAYDVIAAVFPGGTITGAPKVRTMEIIEELEPVRRGPYTGAMGWIDYTGDMEFNITIRTLVVAEGEAHVQAGAGIVIDSDPDREYTESLHKAKALWKALLYSERLAEEQTDVPV
ncbi:anthranilate synthase component I family protein [Paenibacillus turpanensis]|uniref:anthranilate synthase component I family protein n=1 Tax=Paenibacillus turpanensis TaxID=2689078 RepID=UPI001408D1E5|nr:anthranilate synthase component I family protein [Paenibacillus turpanensis]